MCAVRGRACVFVCVCVCSMGEHVQYTAKQVMVVSQDGVVSEINDSEY